MIGRSQDHFISASTARKEIQTMMQIPTTSPTVCRRHGALRRLTLSIALVLGLCLALSTAAAAKVTHLEEGSFGPFAGPSWVGVDNSAGTAGGELYVSELSFSTFESSVFQLEPDGTPTGVVLDGSETPAGFFSFVDFETFQAVSGAKVDGSSGANAGQIFLPDIGNKVVDVFDSTGSYVCQITGAATPSASECAGVAGSQTPSGSIVPLGVAIDPSDGHLFVADGRGWIYEFNEAGEYVGEITDSHITEPGSLAIDSSGNIYVTNGNPFFGGGSAVKLDSSGSFVAVMTEVGVLSSAVDLTNDHVYFGTESGGIYEFDASGDEVAHFGAEGLGLDVNQTTRQVYLTGTAGAIWSGPEIIPDVVTSPATNVEETTTVVHGEVDPAGGTEVESCKFEYGTTTSYGSSAPCSPATPYAGVTSVSANLSGLVDSTEYHFRLVASNENEIESFGEDQTFITKGPPTVNSQSVDGITRSSADVHASINPHGYSTSYVVEYVDQGQYEIDGFESAQSTAPVVVGSQEAPQPVSKALTGLEVETKYHFRFVATSSHGTDEGPDQSFTTVPIVDLEGQYVKSGVRSAKLEAEVNPLGLETTCMVEWVSDADFDFSGYADAASAPCQPQDLGSGSASVEPYAEIDGLDLATVYHFRFVFDNLSGTRVGEDQEFQTFAITDFSMEATDENGDVETQAGARPYELVTKFKLSRTIVQNDAERPAAIAKDILAELPPGLIGNPTAIPRCLRRTVEERKCTGDAQVGTMTIESYTGVAGDPPESTRGIFNTVPPKGKAASFASNYFNVSINGFVDAGIRTGGDYGINAGATNIIEIGTVTGVEVRMWGVPADPSHDADRECAAVEGCASNAEPKPFLRNPTSCTGPLEARGKATTYNGIGEFVTASQELPAITGCNQVEFEPSIEARPTTNVSDSPTGLHVNVHVPQDEDPEGRGTADLKDVVVTLPEGLVVNPSGANGLAGCSPSQIDLDGADPATCPDASKIGTVEVDSPLVDHILSGGVYVATPHDNQFGSLLAIYVAVADPQTGVVIKLAGKVEPDPETGQLTTTFNDNPQLPFNDFDLDFFGGPKAALRTPAACGDYSTTSVLTPWSAPDSGPAATPSDTYSISSAPNGLACPSKADQQPSKPAFSAGAVAPIAGAYSPFIVRLSREDGTQNFASVKVTPPPGLVAKLAGTPYCPEAAIAAAAGKSGAEEKALPSCPAASQIGTVEVGAGAGPAPYYVSGNAYLMGPYKGSPLSMAIVTPAVAGPYDLGAVVVRVALQVNPQTTQITAQSDPLPTILQGIPLDIRSVTVKLDKPQFTTNPTSCDPMSVTGSLLSTFNDSVSLLNPFQVGDCTNLRFAPKLALKLFGGTKRTDHPRLRAVLTMPEGSAAITRASVALPRSEFLEQSHIRTVCTRVQFAANACPSGSVYGYARAFSPLLDQPLEGPVYLRSSNNELPDLVADLNGQIRVELAGRIDSVRGGIRTTFETVPDAPVSKFVLNMYGGKKGLLVNSTNICRGVHRGIAKFDAHSGKVSDSRPTLKAQCRRKGSAGAKSRGGKNKTARLLGRAAAE